MARKVWCVFQKLPGDGCPVLSSVCASREVAEEMARISEEDERGQGRTPSRWTIRAWGVLEGGVGEIEDVQHISDVLDPMRAGVLPVEETDEGEADPPPD